MSSKLYPSHLPRSVIDANFIDLSIRTRERDVIVKISLYECAYGFRRSIFLREMLHQSFCSSRKQLTPVAPPRSKSLTTTVETQAISTVIEDSSSQNIQAALEYIHKGVEAIDFSKVSALKYAKTAQYLMIEALHDFLAISSYNTITGRHASHIDQLYRRHGEPLELFPPKKGSPPQVVVRNAPSRHSDSSQEAYFTLRHLGYTTAPDAKIRVQLGSWVAAYPALLRDPFLYEAGPSYLSGLDIAQLVSRHIA